MPTELTPEQRSFVEQLYQRLRALGVAPDEILEPFRQIPRHCFVDRLFVHEGDGLGPRVLAVTPETSDPDVLERVYVDHAVSIQIRAGRCVSSTSQPSLMAQMMVDVGLRPGLKVLEVGTATGWNAALMSAVVSPGGRVIGIEYDEELAAGAKEHLAREGFADRVTVIAGDGVLGWPAEAPYDAIVVTVACPDLPRAWLTQLADGGRLVMPYLLPDTSAPLLVVQRKGRSYGGRFARWSWFVAVRGGRLEDWPEPVPLEDLGGLPEDEVRRTRFAAWQGGRWCPATASFGFYLLAVGDPNLIFVDSSGHRSPRYALYDPATGSLCVHDGACLIARGPREMSERMADYLSRWQKLGEPSVMAWSVTAKPQPADAVGLGIDRPETRLELTLGRERLQ